MTKPTLPQKNDLVKKDHKSVLNFYKDLFNYRSVYVFPEIKNKTWKEIGDIAKPEAILASNTSSISITAMGNASNRAENFLGLHFFNPVPMMRLSGRWILSLTGSRTMPASVGPNVMPSGSWRRRKVITFPVPCVLMRCADLVLTPGERNWVRCRRNLLGGDR